MNLPKNLSFLRDSSISISLTMMVIYLIMAISAGREFVESQFSGGQNYLVYAIIIVSPSLLVYLLFCKACV